MPHKNHITWEQVYERADAIAYSIDAYWRGKQVCKLYGVPRGGIPVTQAILSCLATLETIAEITANPAEANFIIDDIVDSGSTRDRFHRDYPNTPFFALVNRVPGDDFWYVFPWETSNDEAPATNNILRILQAIGEDPKREGLIETPARVVKSWEEIFAGYQTEPASVFKSFKEGACDEMVLVADIEFYSTCEHHMLPFSGVAHIGYLPDKRVVGVSKLARILDVYARRLQMQERIGTQVVTAIMEHLQPLGAGCIMVGKHHCMLCRGVQKQHSVMVTSALRGKFFEPAVRAEFLQLIQLAQAAKL